MSAPAQIWIQTDHIPDHVALDQIDEKPDADEAHQFTSYTRTDVAQAMVAAAYLDAGNLHQSLWRETSAYQTDQIIKRTHTDAKAALDRIVQEAVKEARQVKPLVWEKMDNSAWVAHGAHMYEYDILRHPDGVLWTYQDVYDEDEPFDCIGRLDVVQAHVQTVYERRILSALKGGEA